MRSENTSENLNCQTSHNLIEIDFVKKLAYFIMKITWSFFALFFVSRHENVSFYHNWCEYKQIFAHNFSIT